MPTYWIHSARSEATFRFCLPGLAPTAPSLTPEKSVLLFLSAFNANSIYCFFQFVNFYFSEKKRDFSETLRYNKKNISEKPLIGGREPI